MARELTRRSDTPNIQEMAGKVAWGATGVALFSAAIAIGALLLTDKHTRGKITDDTAEAVSNIRRLIDFLKKTGEKTAQTIEEIRSS
jgi:hypothetical protein